MAHSRLQAEMKSNILIASLFIALVFAQVLSSIALENELLSKHRVRSSGDGHGRNYVVKEETVDTVYSVKGQRGRGSAGGSDITHNLSRSGSTGRSLLKGPSIYILTIALSCLSLFILQILGF